MNPKDGKLNQNKRTLCTRCLRALRTCYCPEVRPFHTHTQIVLLQHPLEQRKSIGTARMTFHCIQNSKLIVGSDFDNNDQVNHFIANAENHCVVLYPGLQSENLSLLNSQERKRVLCHQKNLVIFVIDGTWRCAKKMLHLSHRLSLLPQICFTPETESEYRIRQQPHQHCLSTIEAVHHLLGIVEPSLDSSSLLELFRGMIERQIQFSRLGQKERELS